MIEPYVINKIANSITFLNPRFELFSVRMHNPGEIDHKFRSKPSTDSGGCRPLIPEQAVHFLIGSGIE